MTGRTETKPHSPNHMSTALMKQYDFEKSRCQDFKTGLSAVVSSKYLSNDSLYITCVCVDV